MRWEPAKSSVLTVRPKRSDFSLAGTLRIWVHATRASGDWLKVAITTRGNDRSRGEPTRVSSQVQITWSGWQEVLMPRRSFESEPGKRRTNWNDVQRVDFSFLGNPAPEFVLHLGELRLGEAEGPNLSYRELVDLIDLGRPELAEVRHWAEAGEVPAAIKALVAHYRHRHTVKWWTEIEPRSGEVAKPTLKRADEAASGYLTILNRRFPFGGNVSDWSRNPTAGMPDQTDEWLWSLNRMGYWKDLGETWWKTRDGKYAAAWVRQLRSWALATPRPSTMDEAPGSGWRGLEAGIRVTESWPDAWYRFLSAPEFTDADLILMLKCFFEHGRYLEEHRVPNPALPASNHFLLAWSGLYTVGVLFPEFKAAAQWRADGAHRLTASLNVGLLSDGAWYELSPDYHLWVLEKALGAYRLAEFEGDKTSFPEAFRQMLRRGYEWPVKLMAPDRALPKVNDTGADDRIRYSPEIARIFPDSALLNWAVSLNHSTSSNAPIAPAWRSVFLAASGYAIMRSGWARSDNYACFDVGNLGGWHGHQDKLSLMLWAYGRELLFDGGGGTYDESIFRKYAQQTESHNTIMVDRLNQNRTFVPEVDPIGLDDPQTPAPVFATQKEWDYARGWYVGGYGPDARHIARHQREVAVLNGGVVFVTDTMSPTDGEAHDYEARWHLKTTHWSHEKSISATVTADHGVSNLAIIPLEGTGLSVREDSAVLSPVLLGWDVERDRKPAPALTVRHGKTGRGVQRFVTLLMPLATGEANPVRSIVRSGETTWTIQCSSGRKLELEIAAFSGVGFKIVETSSAGDRRSYAISGP